MSVADAAAGNGPFEGIVHLSAPGVEGGGDDATFEVKGHKSRWPLPLPNTDQAYRLYDADSRRLYTIFPKRSATVATTFQPGAPSEVVWSFTPAGDGRVAGYPCARSRATGGDETFSFCSVPTLPIPLTFVFPSTAIPFLAALEANGQTPLAITSMSEPTRPGPPSTESARHGSRIERPTVPEGGSPARVHGGPKLIALEVRRAPIDDSRLAVPSFPITEQAAAPLRALPHLAQ